mgnify:CR=1 FL=1
MNGYWKAAAVAAAAAVSLFGLSSAEALDKKKLLYVGTQGGVNAGVVTVDQSYLGSATKVIGYPIDDASAVPAGNFKQAFVGVTPGVNQGVVSRDPNYAGGATTTIGFVSLDPVPQGQRLEVGMVPGCNDGQVSTDVNTKGCATQFFGYLLPQ